MNIHQTENAARLASLRQLPENCVQSADELERQREIYQKYNVFSPAMIDGAIAKLRSYDDKDFLKRAVQMPDFMDDLVTRYFHCG
ncbi:hypothetical protein [uncultured Muribaculum sp.]|uniref:hypothetical protein n=1 Tax=uncultured Muribaculum sp. TaxID=1918613 RepID=UPI0027321B42|nr:hypothetical protein [uncultured Muribaculum sp.]